MKKLLLLFSAAALVLALCACNSPAREKEGIYSFVGDQQEETPDAEPSVPDVPDLPEQTVSGEQTPPDTQDPDPEAPDTQSGDWNLILVNKTHPLEAEIDMTLEKIYGDYKADSRIVAAYKDMEAAAENEGIDLVVHSAYRSISKQQTLYTNKVNKYLGQGYSEADAEAAALSIVAYPGQSEHHTGLCLDITSSQWLTGHGNDPLISEFSDSDSGKWLRENAADYGFILRYPLGKEDVTGYSFEPWHFRYVGTEAAQYIYQNGLTLEEYLISLGL